MHSDTDFVVRAVGLDAAAVGNFAIGNPLLLTRKELAGRDRATGGQRSLGRSAAAAFVVSDVVKRQQQQQSSNNSSYSYSVNEATGGTDAAITGAGDYEYSIEAHTTDITAGDDANDDGVGGSTKKQQQHTADHNKSSSPSKRKKSKAHILAKLKNSMKIADSTATATTASTTDDTDGAIATKSSKDTFDDVKVKATQKKRKQRSSNAANTKQQQQQQQHTTDKRIHNEDASASPQKSSSTAAMVKSKPVIQQNHHVTRNAAPTDNLRLKRVAADQYSTINKAVSHNSSKSTKAAQPVKVRTEVATVVTNSSSVRPKQAVTAVTTQNNSLILQLDTTAGMNKMQQHQLKHVADTAVADDDINDDTADANIR
jgi:hypothetical protein